MRLHLCIHIRRLLQAGTACQAAPMKAVSEPSRIWHKWHCLGCHRGCSHGCCLPSQNGTHETTKNSSHSLRVHIGHRGKMNKRTETLTSAHLLDWSPSICGTEQYCHRARPVSTCRQGSLICLDIAGNYLRLLGGEEEGGGGGAPPRSQDRLMAGRITIMCWLGSL